MVLFYHKIKLYRRVLGFTYILCCAEYLLLFYAIYISIYIFGIISDFKLPSTWRSC